MIARPQPRPSACTWPKPCAWPKRWSSPAPSRSARSSSPRGCRTASISPPPWPSCRTIYARRGVNLVRVGDAWAFRTAGDLAFLMSRDAVQQKKLSRAALEVLAIIAYHQPVTRAEIEDIRGVETSKGTLDLAAGDRMGAPARPAPHAGPAGDLRHHATTSSIISGWRKSATCRAWRNSRAPACCRPHAVQLLGADPAIRSDLFDRRRRSADRYRPRGARPVDTPRHR